MEGKTNNLQTEAYVIDVFYKVFSSEELGIVEDVNPGLLSETMTKLQERRVVNLPACLASNNRTEEYALT